MEGHTLLCFFTRNQFVISAIEVCTRSFVPRDRLTDSNRTADPQYSISVPNFSEEQVAQLSPLYDAHARHFNGPIVRSAEYWSSWVKAESGSPLIMEEGDQIVGYVSFGVLAANLIIVKDFCVREDKWHAAQGKYVLQAFVEHWAKTRIPNDTEVLVEIKYPTAAVGAKIYDELDAKTENNESLLYRILDEQALSEDFFSRILN